MPPRTCQIIVEAFAVLCPHCGAEQPTDNSGSEMWTAEDLIGCTERRKCVSCDAPIRIDTTPKTARFDNQPKAKKAKVNRG